MQSAAPIARLVARQKPNAKRHVLQLRAQQRHVRRARVPLPPAPRVPVLLARAPRVPVPLPPVLLQVVPLRLALHQDVALLKSRTCCLTGVCLSVVGGSFLLAPSATLFFQVPPINKLAPAY